MSQTTDHTNQAPQTFIVSWADEQLSILAKTSHAAIKVFRDYYPQANRNIHVTTYLSTGNN